MAACVERSILVDVEGMSGEPFSVRDRRYACMTGVAAWIPVLMGKTVHE
jgi:hypothetical protein